MMRALRVVAVVFVVLAAFPRSAWAGAGEASFTPMSFLVPVRQVVLAGPSVSSVLYTCPRYDDADGGVPGGSADAGPVDDCFVDVADNDALAGLFDGMIEIAPGTYDRVSVVPCIGEGGFVAKVKGTVELDGTTYYTTRTSAVLSTDASDLDYAEVIMGGCGGGPGGGGGGPLPEAVTIAAGDTVTISSFLTLDNIAWSLLSAGPSAVGWNGCSQIATAGGPTICAAMPSLVTYVGDLAATLDTYRVTEDLTDAMAEKAGGQMLLFLDTEGVPFGGTSRRFYSPTSVAPNAYFDTPIETIKALGGDDGGIDLYDIRTYRGGGTGDKPALRFPAFELQTHTGTLRSFVSGTPTTVDYLAVQQ